MGKDLADRIYGEAEKHLKGICNTLCRWEKEGDETIRQGYEASIKYHQIRYGALVRQLMASQFSEENRFGKLRESAKRLFKRLKEAGIDN